MSETILALDAASKSFNGKPAVRDMSFAVKRGQITGFLGPNGAGKTTSLRMALGMLTPDGASVSLFGKTPQAGVLDDAIMKQLYPPLPLLLVKAATQGKDETRDIYPCPVYMTQDRGPTFVFTAGLKTKAPPIKWVLAGVALLLDVSG